MKTSRKLMQNGGITIPKDMRLKLGWKRGMSLDISVSDDGTLTVRKHSENCRFCGKSGNLIHFKDLHLCRNCAKELKGALS